MKLYKISQDTNNGYDTFDSAVVAAPSREAARRMHPRARGIWDEDDWTAPEYVKVEYLGITKLPQSVICASFNAG